MAELTDWQSWGCKTPHRLFAPEIVKLVETVASEDCLLDHELLLICFVSTVERAVPFEMHSNTQIGMFQPQSLDDRA